MRQREMKFHVVTDAYAEVAKNLTLTAAVNAVKWEMDRIALGASLLIVYTKGEFDVEKPLYLHSKTTKLNNYVVS